MRRVFRFPDFPSFPEFPRFPETNAGGKQRRMEIDLSELAELLERIVDEKIRKRELEEKKETNATPIRQEPPPPMRSGYVRFEDDEKEHPIPKVIKIIPQDDEQDDTPPPESKKDAGLEYDLAEPDRIPRSVFEMDLEKLFGPIVSNKAFKEALRNNDQRPRKDPFVFISNRLTFLIQTKFPLIFDTSLIETRENSITVAINEDKTYPKLNHIDEVGFITSEINRDDEIQKEIKDYLNGTEHESIYCFPTVTRKDGSDGEQAYGVKFVVYSKRKHHNFGPAIKRV